MKATLLFPRNIDDGKYLEDICIFAARRCRTTRDHSILKEEIKGYSESKKKNFISKVVGEEWAIDILEFATLIYDLEEIPYWMVMELLRHRVIARDFSLEMMSQRAISPTRLAINKHNHNESLRKLYNDYMFNVDVIAHNENIKYEDLRDFIGQGVEVNFCIAGNVRAFHHFFWMRNSITSGGKGGAHPQFQELANSMYEQAKSVYPNIVGSIVNA